MAVNSDTAMDVAAVATTVGQPEGQWSLDAARSRAEFHVKHFWGAITVHGLFERLQGEGTVGPGGMISGRLVIDAASLNTNNPKRDQHLRSAEFFDVAHHPDVVVSVRDLTLADATALCGRVAVEAAGREQEFEGDGDGAGGRPRCGDASLRAGHGSHRVRHDLEPTWDGIPNGPDCGRRSLRPPVDKHRGKP